MCKEQSTQKATHSTFVGYKKTAKHMMKDLAKFHQPKVSLK